MSTEIDPRDKCFRCRKYVSNKRERGHLTIAGYFSGASPAFYDSFMLCEECGLELDRCIRKCLFDEIKPKKRKDNL